MKRHYAAAALLLGLVFSLSAPSQNFNASVGGFAQDTSQAFIPGVTITATNTQTGVAATAITNESGAYNIPSLLPGTYKISAELPGFRTQVFNDVQLGNGVSARYNFTLQVGSVDQSVEVTAEATALLAETSPTIGQVLPEKQIRDLPLVTNNVLDLMKTMAGVRGSGLGTGTTFAGISTSMVNTVRDGLSVQEGRYANGVFATTLVNPDMVGEFRVILTPVDAELGRGNGQVQIVTRSGTNQFRGTAVWSIRNSALDANTWSNNKQIVRGVWTPGKPTWINRNQDTVSLGGPIIKNKTFFFALWDQQFERQHTIQRPVVLTDCARNGVFRYWDSWANGNLNTVTSSAGANPTIQSVDSFGNPLQPATNPNGTPYNGQLRYFSVFGPLLNTPAKPDCSDAVVQGAAWNSLRPGMDPSGISQTYLAAMPHANIFDGGDGLNTAVHQWTRSLHDNAGLSIAAGTNTDTDRKQINTKIDHNFNSRNKIAANYSYEWTNADYLALTTTTWPGGYTSEVTRRPRVLTVNFTSTLTSSLLNEARFGYRSNVMVTWAPWEVSDAKQREVPLSMLLKGGASFPIAYAPASVQGSTAQTAMTPNSYSCFTNCAQMGNSTPLWDYADTMSWTHGKHGFKGGVDFRFAYTRGSETPTAPIPRATGGPGLNPNQAFQNATNFPGLVAVNQTMANSLLYFLSGSLDNAFQYYFLQDPNDLTKWDNYVTKNRKVTEPHQNEFSVFFKDDWKVRPSFTLNMGLRYEFYGVPYEGQGLTAVPAGGGISLFGVSGRSFDRWMRPDNPVDLNLKTVLEFVGPKTKNSDKTIYKNDWNNFGPAVGFAWQLPWFGKGKTNIRGGYQITYQGGGNAGNFSNAIFSNQGFVYRADTQGPTDGSYFDTRNLSSLIPIPTAVLPMQPIPLTKANVSGYAFDYNYVTPYIQNYTLSVTRELARNFSVDVRYIGTRALKLRGDFDLNAPDVFYNPTLFDALTRTRKGEDVALFDQMFMGLNLNPGVRGCDPVNPTATCGAVNGTTQRGSEHLRLSSTFRDALANGDFATVATALNVFNGVGSGASGAVVGVPGERGTVLRRANQGINVPGGATVVGSPSVPAGLFPENWITANPQFGSAFFFSNLGSSNYHSLQLQGTMRPIQGLSFQGTYVWSKALELSGSSYLGPTRFTNPTDRNKDYTLNANNVTHDFRSYGTFELPFGPNKQFFRKTSGLAARLIEGWQTSFIVNLSTGQPLTVAAGNMLYTNGVPDIVGASSTGPGHVQWNGDFGNYYADGTFGKVVDPQCNAVAVDLKPYCTLQGVTNAKTGQVVLQNPQPGTRGTLGRQTLEQPGQWSFDTAMSKTVRIRESKTLQIRLDATNILNHPIPNAPSVDLNSSNPFGFIQSKGDQIRQFKGQVRLTF